MAGFSLWESGFRLTSCKGTIQYEVPSSTIRAKINVASAQDTYIHYQLLLGKDGVGALTLPVSAAAETAMRNEVVLKRGFGPRYRICFEQVQAPHWAQYPFFLFDTQRTMFVRPKTEPIGRPKPWAKANKISMDARLSTRALATAATATTLRPIVRSVAASPTQTSSKPATPPCGPAPARLMALASDQRASTGAPVLTLQHRQTRALVQFANEGAGPGATPIRVVAGSDAAKTIAISQPKTIPVVAPVAPLSIVVPLLQPVVDRYLFETHYHPYTCELIKQVARYGVDGLLEPPAEGITGLSRQTKNRTFTTPEFEPTKYVATPYPLEEFDFSMGGAYSMYNWEVFFHIPIHIALRLVADQRFEEALRWFHAVFNPMERPSGTITGAERVWKIKPFFESGKPASIDDLLTLLSYGGDDEKLIAQKRDVELQIADWRARPFEPHRIARFRIGAYQRFVALKYVEALIAWGDQLFRRETLESINEATQLYVLGLRILGRRPERVERQVATQTKSFRQLIDPATPLDAFSNALVSAESMVTESSIAASAPSTDEAMPFASGSYMFCIPPNDRMLGLWDLVEDRLFKIRHSMSIEGVVRQLPLFEPPIDPALLVRARALGLDLSSVLDDLNSPAPVRRFRVLVAKAQEMCGELKALSAALLSALEKRDGEELARIRERHQREILDLTRDVRDAQIREARETLAGLQQSLESARLREAHYARLLAQGQLAEEDNQQLLLTIAGYIQASSQAVHGTAGYLALVPQYQTGSPAATSVSFGGMNLHKAAVATATVLDVGSSILHTEAGRLGYRALMKRRQEDWTLQRDLARTDGRQIERQVAAQEIRVAIAERELVIQERQIEQAKETEDFLRDKYTNKELYDWMVGQLSALYFQSYKLAFDLAKRAERAFQFERAEPSRTFVKFGAWESMRKGLLAGERLSLDLRRMEAAYLNEDKRDLELVKHVSLAMLSPNGPDALVSLRETGKCEIEIPEAIFDMDTPGHYLRRIRNLSVTLPSVSGPYVPVRCTVTHKSSKFRMTPSTAGTALVQSDVSVQAVVTSHARDDGATFETDPRDDRYFPFEGAGVNASLAFELPNKFRAFDYRTIQDLVLHIRYTARDGSAATDGATTFRTAVENSVQGKVAASSGTERPLLLISLKRDLPDAWRQLVQPPTLPPAWANSRAYVVGDRVTNNNSLYQCTTAGTSASTGTGPSGTGTGITDGTTCVWKYLWGVNSRSIDVPLLRDRFPFGFFDKSISAKTCRLCAIITNTADYPDASGTDTIKVDITKPGGTTAAAAELIDSASPVGAPFGGMPISSAVACDAALSATDYNLNLVVKDIDAVTSLKTGTPARFDPAKLLDLVIVLEYGVS